MPSPLRALTSNWKLKLLAFALAVLLWIVVSAEETTSNWIPLPLEVQMADPEYRLVEGSVPPEVEVRFVGAGRELWDLLIRRPPVVLRVTSVEETEQSFRLDPDMAQVPRRLAVDPQDVRPSAVRLQFIPLDSRTVPVRVRIGEGLGVGWTLVDTLQVQPQRVRISGPRAEVERIASIPTRAITLSPDDTAFTAIVPLDTTQFRGLRLSATRVRVTGRIDRVTAVTFGDLPVVTEAGVRIVPTTANVQLLGAQRALSRIAPNDFRLILAIDSIPSDVPPEGLSVPIRVEGLPPGIQANPSPRSVLLLPSPAAERAPAAPAVEEDTVPADTTSTGGR